MLTFMAIAANSATQASARRAFPPIIIGREYQGFQMSIYTCLVTEGELVKLAYDAFGVLLRKEASHDEID
ncbi:hypothetical protein C206_08679 [Pseudomonas putida TRO1]|uniref:Uncharacterized protein n=2 Tax=Pseudomonas putida group TaxID=136845 RepID=A0AAP7FKT5_9PSED|nr:hypothetical protein C206_08679 [Pseudomonas putida TRO1]OAH47913.1 hypothetical protein AYJ70_05885 [Pseudomonas monteilii]